MKTIFRKTTAIISFLVSTVSLFAQCSEIEMMNLKKTAIVFGETNYKYAPSLTNPVHDAADIADSLKKIGFNVYTYFDSDLKTMNTAVDDWCAKIKSFDVALFYFSGHGAEVDGENYLFVTDQDPKGPSDLRYMAFSATQLLDRMNTLNLKYNIMVLDACRDNPFTKKWVRDISGKGLGSMNGNGSFVAFAASPGHTAQDGSGRNGTYTEAILQYITIPNLTIDQLFTKVNLYVRNKTKDAQIPFKNSSFSSDYCFSMRYQKKNSISPKVNLLAESNSILLDENEETIVSIDSAEEKLYFNDALSLNLADSIQLPKIKPTLINRAGKFIYIIDSNSQLFQEFDLVKKSRTLELNLKGKAICMAVNPSSNKAYIGQRGIGENDLISLVDLDTRKIINTISVDYSINSLLLSKDGRYLYFLTKANTGKSWLSALDTKSNKITSLLTLEFIALNFSLSPDNKRLYISSSKELHAYDRNSLALLTTLNFSISSFCFTSDSKYIFLVSKSEIIVLRTADNVVTNRLPFVTFPKGIVISSEGRGYISLPSEKRIFVFSVIETLENEVAFDAESEYERIKEEVRKKGESDNTSKNATYLDTAHFTYMEVLKNFRKDMPDRIETIQTGWEMNYKTLTLKNKCGLYNKFDPEKVIWPTYTINITNGKLIFIIEENGTEEKFDTSINNPNWDGLSKFVRTYYIKRFKQLNL